MAQAAGFLERESNGNLKFTPATPGSGVDEFIDLTDTPASYVDKALYLLTVNAGATAVEFVAQIVTAQIADNAVTHAKYQQVATQTLLGRNTAGTGNVTALTALPTGIDALYARLLGRAGGQTLIGGTASGNDLTLESTSHSTKGRVYVPGLFYLQNTTNQQFFMRRGTADQSWSHDITSGGFYQIVSREGDGTVKFAALFIDPDNGNVGIGGAPQTRFHVALEAGGGHAVRSISLTSTGTWVTVLSSGTVGALVQLRGVISRSGHASGVSGTIALGAPAATIYSNGGNVVDAEVTSGGVFRVQRSAGSATITVALDMVWI